jgi:hypothetical protein
LIENSEAEDADSGPRARDAYLLVLYVAVAVVFLYVVLMNRRNYQDLWILDGIALPTILFVCFSFVVEILVHGNKRLVFVASFFLFVLNLVPGLKYQFLNGVWDSPAHYRFASAIVSSGHIPENIVYSGSYGTNPSMHIFMSCTSIVSGLSMNDVFRFVFPGILSVTPFIIYLLTKDVLPDGIQRYAIIVSSFPVIGAYVVYGTNLGLIPYLFVIALFIRQILVKSYRKEFWLLFVIFSFGLIISHVVTSLLVAFLLVGIALVLKSVEVISAKKRGFLLNRPLTSTSTASSLFYLVLLAVWWMNMSVINLEEAANNVKRLLTGGTFIPAIPTRFYQIPLPGKLQVLAVLHLGDFVIAALSLFCVIILAKSQRFKSTESNNRRQTFYLLLVILLGLLALLLSFEFITGFGSIQYERFVIDAMPLCIPLAGLTLWWFGGILRRISSKVLRTMILASMVFVLGSVCLIQFFPYQPLIPKADIVSSNLPGNEFLTDFGSINTPYQITMISFAESHSSDGRVAADVVTRCQTYGFSNSSFYSRILWPSPLAERFEWDLLMLHTEKAGPFGEKAEYRTKDRIESLRLSYNIIYDNGESFAMSRNGF